ncbi:MAG: ribonuclease Z [Conexivisphaerales archaeon]
MFRVTVLGSSAAMPSRSRGLPSIAVEREGELFLFDCGEGTQRQLISANISKYQPDAIIISHSHGDHVLGIFGLLLSMSLHGREKPVKLIAPSKVKEMVDFVLGRLNSSLGYDVEFTEVRQGVLLKSDEYVIRAARASHHDEAYSFRLDERERPGKFYPEKAMALGIPRGPLWQKLQHGRSVRLNGKKIRPEEVVGPPRKGRSFGYSGDTRPVKRLQNFFKGVDLLIFDSTYSEEYAAEARRFGHSTAAEAAKLAAAAGVGKLVLTHFSQRISQVSKMVEEARKYHEDVVAAEDLSQFEIPLHL